MAMTKGEARDVVAGMAYQDALDALGEDYDPSTAPSRIERWRARGGEAGDLSRLAALDALGSDAARVYTSARGELAEGERRTGRYRREGRSKTMATRTDIVVGIIREERAACVEAARAQGYDGLDDEYDLTAEDCESITDRTEAEVGRKPTRSEWLDVLGRRAFVGGAHCEPVGE